MWSRKQSVCSAVSGASKGDEGDGVYAGGLQIYPFAIALRVRVLQIVCGIGGMVVGAVGWLEERQKIELGLGVPAGAVTVLAAATSVYYSRGFGGWTATRSGAHRSWGAPWRALGPSPCAAIPLALLWTAAITAHVAMVAFCVRSLLNIGVLVWDATCVGTIAPSHLHGTKHRGGAAAEAAEALKRHKYKGLDANYNFISFGVKTLGPWGRLKTRNNTPVNGTNVEVENVCRASIAVSICGSTTCMGVAGAQLSVSISTLAAAVFMLQLDLRYDAALSPPPRQSDMHTCTAVSMVPLTSVAIHSGNSGDADPGGSPQDKSKEPQSPPEPT